MDFYDSNYPLGYYSIGERYMFYRHMDNANFWFPEGEEERAIYRESVAPYMEKFPEADERIVLEDGSLADPLPEEKEQKARAEEYDGLTAFQRSQLGVVTPKTGMVEGKVVSFRNLNKESGVVIGKSNATGVAMLTVLFDDGLVYEYVCGQPASLNQSDLPAKPPKGKIPPDLIRNHPAKKVPSFLAEPELPESVEEDARNPETPDGEEESAQAPDAQSGAEESAQNPEEWNSVETPVLSKEPGEYEEEESGEYEEEEPEEKGSVSDSEE